MEKTDQLTKSHAELVTKISRLPKRVDGVGISRVGEIPADANMVNIAEKNRIWKLEPQGFGHFARRMTSDPERTRLSHNNS